MHVPLVLEGIREVDDLTAASGVVTASTLGASPRKVFTGIKTGDPWDPSVLVGPLMNEPPCRMARM